MESPRTKLPAEERRALTVETVIALAAEQNPSEITTSAIAERMNLTQGALFRHFPTKEAIWEAVMEWVASRMAARVDAAATSQASPLAALEAIYMSHIDFVMEHPGVPRMIFGELQRGGDTPAKRMVQKIQARYAERLREIVERGKASGEIEPSVDTAAAAMLFLGSIQGLVMQSLISGNVKAVRKGAPSAFAIYARGLRRVP